MRGNNEVTENKLNEGVHGDQISKSGSKVDALKKVDMEPNYEEQREEKDESLAIELPNKLPKANGKKCGKGISQSKRLANNIIKNKVRGDQSLQQVGSRSVVAVKDTDEPKANGSDQREEESIVRANKRKNTNSKCMSDISRRSSKRHAQVDVGPSLEVAENNGQAMILGMSDINSPVEFGNYNKSSEHPTTKFQTGNKQKEHMTSSNGDLSCIQDNKNVLVEIKEDKKELDSSLNDLLMDDPCIEFAIKTLTGAFPIENVNNVGENPPMSSSMASSSKQTSASASSSVLPCDDIWADPCFEFAVKTLTGEMPKEDNNVSNTELSFHQAFNSLGATAKLDGGYLSDYTFSQFEAEKKLSAKQQGVRDPPLPHHAVNGSLGDLVGQQPSPRR
ncbi:hypothetical protein ACJIZ3_009188 [Penstemon smallii]|uniref:Uncharacterized protein n=1 Tax=Penstemon smallii TaxID=265156 RepID=A0ABD3TBT9_9LAMI